MVFSMAEHEGIECCFCGTLMVDFEDSHDIRPLVTARGDRCCDICNRDVVVPSRAYLWPKMETLYGDDKDGMARFV